MLYVIFILLYFLSGDAFIKMLPCLFLAHESDKVGLMATFTFAALGDFFFHAPETFFVGVLFFTIMNLSLIKNIRELYASNYVLIWTVWMQYLALILVAILQYVFYSVFQNLVTLLIVDVYATSLLYMLYTTFAYKIREVRINKFNLSCRHAAILFVVSDIFILLKFATEMNLSIVGLPLYWASMSLFHSTLKTNL